MKIRNILHRLLKESTSDEPTLDTYAELAYKSKNWKEFLRKLHLETWGLTIDVLLKIFNIDSSIGNDKILAVLKKEYFKQKRRYKEIIKQRNKENDKFMADFHVDNIIHLAKLQSDEFNKQYGIDD